MDSGHVKKRKSDNIERAAADRLNSKKRKNEKAVDRLSRLPNDLIHKILSFISIKDTVKTSALSSRYRFIWTTMPYLNFSTEDFPKLQKFSKFLTQFLKRRNNQIDVSCLNLSFRGKVNQPSVKKLLDYAYSHNVQRFDVKYLLENNIEFPKNPFFDRLSRLPNDLIHKILSFISIKDTVKTSALSSRYRFIWTTMPYLNFSTEDFPKLQKFSKFLTQFLKRRNNQIDVSCLNLSFRGKVNQPSVKKLLDYAYSHNVQRFDVKYLLENNIEFPFSLFSSGQSLKHLSLKSEYKPRRLKKRFYLKATSTLELPALTTLYLQDVTFYSHDHTDHCVGLLSKCANLKNLTLENCETTEELSSFSICHPGLVNLTLDEGNLRNVKVVNVAAPQLENLTIRCHEDYRREHVIFAPNIASLAYRGHYPLHLSTDGFHCLKEADICVLLSRVDDAHQIVCLLQQLHNVRFLKLNLEMVEEIRAMKDAKLAPKLMTSLQRLLKQEKAKTETSKAHMERWKTAWRSLMENCHEEDRAKLENKMKMTHINSCWEDMSVQIKKGKKKDL